MNLGTAVTFESDEARESAIAYLDDTHFVIAYHDAGDAGHEGKCICGSISGTTPSLGSAVDFETGHPENISIDRLDSTHFVIAYSDNDDSDKGKCICGSVSGTTITMGAIVTFEAGITNYLDVCGMDSTHFVISFRDDNDTDGKCIGASISGTTITLGSSDIFSSSSENALYTSICSLDSSHFAIAYQSSSPAYGKVVCGTISGNTASVIADSGESFITEDTARDISIASLSSSSFIIAFNDKDSLNYTQKAIVGTVSGVTVSISADTGTEWFSTAQRIEIRCPNQYQFIIAFVDYGDLYKGKVIQGSVSGTTITTETAVTFETGSCGSQSYLQIGLCIIGDYFGIAFTDKDDSIKGKVIIGRYSAVRSGVASISSVPSIAISANAIFSGGLSITSTPSLSIVGNFYTFAYSAINASSSLDIFGGTIKQGDVSIDIISDFFAEWRVVGRCQIQSISTMDAAGKATFSGAIPITAVSSVSANGSSILSGIIGVGSTASLSASADKYRFGTVSISAVSSAEIDALAYVIQSMGYTGTLTAGDVLVIDCDEQTVELNGANATRYFTGEFPMLYSGTNELRWKDEDGSRDVTFETKHDPRYL